MLALRVARPIRLRRGRHEPCSAAPRYTATDGRRLLADCAACCALCAGRDTLRESLRSTGRPLSGTHEPGRGMIVWGGRQGGRAGNAGGMCTARTSDARQKSRGSRRDPTRRVPTVLSARARTHARCPAKPSYRTVPDHRRPRRQTTRAQLSLTNTPKPTQHAAVTRCVYCSPTRRTNRTVDRTRFALAAEHESSETVAGAVTCRPREQSPVR